MNYNNHYEADRVSRAVTPVTRIPRALRPVSIAYCRPYGRTIGLVRPMVCVGKPYQNFHRVSIGIASHAKSTVMSVDEIIPT